MFLNIRYIIIYKSSEFANSCPTQKMVLDKKGLFCKEASFFKHLLEASQIMQMSTYTGCMACPHLQKP